MAAVIEMLERIAAALEKIAGIAPPTARAEPERIEPPADTSALALIDRLDQEGKFYRKRGAMFRNAVRITQEPESELGQIYRNIGFPHGIASSQDLARAIRDRRPLAGIGARTLKPAREELRQMGLLD